MLQRIAVRLARIAFTLWFHLRLPLPCRVRSLLVNRRSSRVICLLADQLLVRKPLANNVAHGDIEAIRIRHLAVIVAESLFIEIAEQVEGFN